MYSQQLSEIVARDSKMSSLFGGVYPRDFVPPLDPERSVFYIWNTDDHTEEGTHWILTGTIHQRIIYADPLGRPYEEYGVSKWIKQSEAPVVSLEKCIQSDTSTMCGGFCLMMLWLLSRNYSLISIDHLFSSIPARNDQIVQSFCFKKLGINLKKMIEKNSA